MNKFCSFFLIFIYQLSAFSQSESQKSELTLLSFQLGYGFNLPGGDLAKRYGASLATNLGLELLSKGKNSIGLEYAYHFGSQIKEDVFAPYRNENGFVIGINGYAGNLFLRQRGSYLGLNIGHIFKPRNKVSGIKLTVGGGLLSHYIRFVDDTRNIKLVDEPYSKGYDRLTRGFAAKQEISYEYHSAKGATHFNIGFNIIEGFTKQIRKVNFDTGAADLSNRLDLLYGLRITWMVPLYKSLNDDGINYY